MIHCSAAVIAAGSIRHIRVLPTFSVCHDAARLEHLHVLDHGGQGHGQGTRQLTHGCGAQGQALHHGTPAAVGQGLEGPIEVDRLVKHVLEYMSGGLNSKVIT